jgi:hypothetical protein
MNLTEEHLKQLDAFIQEMPVKYGLPLIDFFNQIVREQTTEEQKPEGPR